jgi:hypothetical protein
MDMGFHRTVYANLERCNFDRQEFYV